MSVDKLCLAEELSSPVASVERQHQSLVDFINLMMQRAENGRIEKFENPLGSFVEKLTEHFRDEEAIMEKAGYPGLEWHCAHHRQSLSRIEDTLARCRKRGYADEMDFRRLHDGVTLDIAQADIKFYEYLRDTGQVDRFNAADGT